MILGKIEISGAHIIFNDDGSVESTVENNSLRELLEFVWKRHLQRDSSPSHGQLGAEFINNWAAKLGGRAVLPRASKTDANVIY